MKLVTDAPFDVRQVGLRSVSGLPRAKEADEQHELQFGWIRTIPQRSAGDVSPGQRDGIMTVAPFGPTGVLATLVIAGWPTLR